MAAQWKGERQRLLDSAGRIEAFLKEQEGAGQWAEPAVETLHLAFCQFLGGFDKKNGGFSRYSTDGQWLVPHFEKMLYDNALLLMAYAQAYGLTGRELYRYVAKRTLGYVKAELTHELGGFYCGQDADSDGVEGRLRE